MLLSTAVFAQGGVCIKSIRTSCALTAYDFFSLEYQDKTRSSATASRAESVPDIRRMIHGVVESFIGILASSQSFTDHYHSGIPNLNSIQFIVGTQYRHSSLLLYARVSANDNVRRDAKFHTTYQVPGIRLLGSDPWAISRYWYHRRYNTQ